MSSRLDFVPPSHWDMHHNSLKLPNRKSDLQDTSDIPGVGRMRKAALMSDFCGRSRHVTKESKLGKVRDIICFFVFLWFGALELGI